MRLGGRALDILIVLTARAGQPVTRDELAAAVWGGAVVEESNLRVNISALRKALGDGEDGNRYVANIPRRGYSFVAPVTVAKGFESVVSSTNQGRQSGSSASAPRPTSMRSGSAMKRRRSPQRFAGCSMAFR